MRTDIEVAVTSVEGPVVSAPEITVVTPRKRGRPRLHKNDAAKKQASRTRLEQQKLTRGKESDRLSEIDAIVKSSPGRFLVNEQLAVTGGFGSLEIEIVDAAIEFDTGRVKPAGHGPSDSGDRNDYSTLQSESARGRTVDTEYSFISRREFREFLANAPQLGPTSLNNSKVHFFCCQHSFVEADTPDAFQDPETQRWTLTFAARLKKKKGGSAWELACGCSRIYLKHKKNIVTSERDVFPSAPDRPASDQPPQNNDVTDNQPNKAKNESQ